jgi:hypothetical protein
MQVSQIFSEASDAIPLFENSYCFKIIETGFAEQFYASHRMGAEQILWKISV